MPMAPSVLGLSSRPGELSRAMITMIVRISARRLMRLQDRRLVPGLVTRRMEDLGIALLFAILRAAFRVMLGKVLWLIMQLELLVSRCMEEMEGSFFVCQKT